MSVKIVLQDSEKKWGENDCTLIGAYDSKKMLLKN